MPVTRISAFSLHLLRFTALPRSLAVHLARPNPTSTDKRLPHRGHQKAASKPFARGRVGRVGVFTCLNKKKEEEVSAMGVTLSSTV